MADVTKPIHVKVSTFDPAQGRLIPVPNASLLVEDSGWLWDPNLSSGSFVTDAEGRATVNITFDEEEESSLNPFFTITVPSAHRKVPSGAAAERQFELPDEWVTRHYVSRRIPRITDFADPANVLELFVGLPASLGIAYSDFHPSGLRNPVALPEDTARLHLADYDDFLWIDWLNPDDAMTGVGFNSSTGRIVPAGEHYPYFDVWPTERAALDAPPATPRAWLDPPGAPVGTLGGASYDHVGPLAVDGHGFVFMVDKENASGSAPPKYRIHRFYPDGTLCETLPDSLAGSPLSAPQGLALDSQRNLFIADTGNNRIVIVKPTFGDGSLAGFTGSYNYSFVCAGSGSAPGKVTDPRGLAVLPRRAVGARERLLVGDNGNGRVQVLEIHSSTFGSFTHLASFTPPASPSGAAVPVGVAVDRAGRVLVCDRAGNRVTRWGVNEDTGAATLEATWGRSGSGPGEFNGPEAIAVDRKNSYVYVMDSGNHRVQRLDADSGNHLVDWAPSLPATAIAPGGIAVDGRGEVYLADTANHRVFRGTTFGTGGSQLADTAAPRTVGEPWTARTSAQHMNAPGYVSSGRGGALWVSDTGNNRVLRYTRDTTGRLAPATAPPPTDLDGPRGVAEDGEGNVFIVDSGHHRVRRYSAALAHVADIGAGTRGSGPDQFADPRGIAIAQRMEPILYIADTGNDRVQRLRRDGASAGASLTSADGQTFKQPEDVAVDSRGHVYVADTGNARIVEFDGDDRFVRSIRLDVTFAPAGPPASPASVSFGEPSGVSIDPQDKLLVTDRRRAAVFRLDRAGTLLAFWDLKRLLNQNVAEPVEARRAGVVRHAPGMKLRAIKSRYGSAAWVLEAPDRLTVGADAYPLSAGSIVLVRDGQSVAQGQRLAVKLTENIYDRDLAHLLVLREPSRAVIDARGLLAIADTKHDRIRLLRTATDLGVNLFDLGEALPDVSFRAHTKADWRESLGLELNVGDVSIFDETHDFITRPVEDFSADTYEHRQLLGESRDTNAAVNAMRVIRSVQRWLQQLTSTAPEDERWGGPGSEKSLGVDIYSSTPFIDSKGEGAFMVLEVNVGRNSPHGRGNTAWDDSVVAHEFTHWFFYQVVLPTIPFSIVGLFDLAGNHTAQLLDSHNKAISEGFAEYVEHFWGSEFESIDRVRGFPFGTLPAVARGDEPLVFIFGGPATGATPTWDKPEQGLMSEGYFANTMYQLHRALVDPDVLFADSPAYWHGFNTTGGEARSRRFYDLIWRPLRMWPPNPTPEEFDVASKVYLKNVLRQANTLGPEAAETARSILELNNMLMPRIELTAGTSQSAPGTPVGERITLRELETRSLIARVTDATGAPIPACNLLFKVGHPAAYGFSPSGAGPAARHGYDSSKKQPPPPNELNRATNEHGIVNLTFEGPPVSPTATRLEEVLEVVYQPDFDTDRSFDPPRRSDDLETTLRRSYLYELRRAAKSWGGSGNNFGAKVSRSVTFEVRAL